jgi:hypothetical protein
MGSSAAGSTSTPTARQQRGAGAGAGAAPSSSSPVFLNVYDVTPANGYARWLGLGVYHSGVQGTWTTGSLPPSSPPSVLTLRHGPRVILTRLLSLSIHWLLCSSRGGVRVRRARRREQRDLRGGAAAVPRVRVPGVGGRGRDGAEPRRGARADGGAGRRVPRGRLQPGVPQLQPLLRRRVPAPRRARPHPALGQPPRQDRGRLHLRHPGQRPRRAPALRREPEPEPVRAAAAADLLPDLLRRPAQEHDGALPAGTRLGVNVVGVHHVNGSVSR